MHNYSGINVQLIYDHIRMVEWIDDSRLKVTLSINRPNVRAKVRVCIACRKCEQS